MYSAMVIATLFAILLDQIKSHLQQEKTTQCKGSSIQIESFATTVSGTSVTQGIKPHLTVDSPMELSSQFKLLFQTEVVTPL